MYLFQVDSISKFELGSFDRGKDPEKYVENDPGEDQ